MRGVVAILFLSYAAVYVVGALADPAQKRDATFDDFPQGAPVVFLPGVIGLSESPVVREFRALYSDCAISAALVMARISPEPAEVIARAAVGKCAAEREISHRCLERIEIDFETRHGGRRGAHRDRVPHCSRDRGAGAHEIGLRRRERRDHWIGLMSWPPACAFLLAVALAMIPGWRANIRLAAASRLALKACSMTSLFCASGICDQY
jgi:hypothetical protein